MIIYGLTGLAWTCFKVSIRFVFKLRFKPFFLMHLPLILWALENELFFSQPEDSFKVFGQRLSLSLSNVFGACECCRRSCYARVLSCKWLSGAPKRPSYSCASVCLSECNTSICNTLRKKTLRDLKWKKQIFFLNWVISIQNNSLKLSSLK